ncbi:alpha/beta fold hydrolase [Lentzea tibetensis]|uniref:Alpha/beta fold hydrolase n=2 Tax=Lentzea tibetensis TaxID=2591470 RepID=A0A563EWA9_9PSEU|nr:alpha/beta fold hydrolase [Lentzea tibetensis]
MWEPQLPALAGHRVLRPDFRGYGAEPAVPSFDPAADVRALLDGPVVLVGSSFGGSIAQEVACRWPSLVSGLVLLCPGRHGVPLTPAISAWAARERELLATGDVDGVVELAVETWLGPEADEVARKSVREMKRRSVLAQLGHDAEIRRTPVDAGEIRVPTLVVSGGHDVDYFQQVAESLAHDIPGARHVHLDWAGHLPNLERPDAVNALLEDFLALE